MDGEKQEIKGGKGNGEGKGNREGKGKGWEGEGR